MATDSGQTPQPAPPVEPIRPGQYDPIIEAAKKAGQASRIALVKAVREATGLALRDAIYIVDEYCARHPNELPQPGGAYYRDDPYCPKCNSRDVKYGSWWGCLLLLALPFVVAMGYWTLRSLGETGSAIVFLAGFGLLIAYGAGCIYWFRERLGNDQRKVKYACHCNRCGHDWFQETVVDLPLKS